MERKRERRRQRAIYPSAEAIEINSNDVEIFSHLATLRYLTPRHLADLTGKKSKDWTTRRLKQLSARQHQYLKPYFNKDVPLPLHWPDVYMLDKRGEDDLLANGAQPEYILRQFRKKHRLPAINFKHDFPACHVAASIMAGAYRNSVDVITWQQLLAKASIPTFKLPCTVKYRFPDGTFYKDDKARMKPDQVLGLKAQRYHYFTIELERGNPIEPAADLDRASSLRKFLELDDIHEQARWTDEENKRPDYERIPLCFNPAT